MTAAATLAIAVGIGFVMQSSDAAQERYGKGARPASELPASVDIDAAPVTLGQMGTNVLLEVQDIELTSATEVTEAPVPEAEATVQRVSFPAPASPPSVPDEIGPMVEGCDITAKATAFPGAVVQVVLDAPCMPNERLTVHHSGMIFAEATDADGAMEVTIPALAQEAVFILAFANGDGAVAQTSVEDMDNYERVALQWRGKSGFQLHAREFGADYGAEGHVWFGATQDVSGLQTGTNGFLMRLGDDRLAEPLVVEVYTFASAMAAQSGTIDLSVEAEVTKANCGQEIAAQSLEILESGRIKTRDLTLSVPACDAVGSFLVLNNLVADMKVASN